MEFRLLEADEIDCRVATVSDKGVSILLYKDARVDMNILDETVGPMNWKRSHSRDNANCTVSIWDPDKNQWIDKEDTGKESNNEKEKGLASDSFKRACFNWGIGRELYTAPFIWIKAENTDIGEKNGKKVCNDSFRVREIHYDDDKKIKSLEIVNRFGKVVFTKGNVDRDTDLEADKMQKPAENNPINANEKVEAEISRAENSPIDSIKSQTLLDMIARDKVDSKKLFALYNVNGVAKVTNKKFVNMINHWDKIVEQCPALNEGEAVLFG